jgi:hypothetical protein
MNFSWVQRASRVPLRYAVALNFVGLHYQVCDFDIAAALRRRVAEQR